MSVPTPPATLQELDIRAPGLFTRADYYELLAWLRHHDPVHRLGETPTWLVTRYHDIRDISSAPDRFASRYGVLVNDQLRATGPDDDSGSIIHLDPPRHGEYRNVLNREFTPRAVGRYCSRTTTSSPRRPRRTWRTPAVCRSPARSMSSWTSHGWGHRSCSCR